MAGEVILVVDDNPANAALVAFLLTKKGFEVLAAGDALEALTILEAARDTAQPLPRLIMMDLQLPGMDGLTLTKRLKADARTAGILIVALTAYAMKGDEQLALAAGCDAYVSKPIDTRTLPQLVSALLAKGAQAPGQGQGPGQGP